MMTALFDRLFGGHASGVFRGMATLALGTASARIIGVASIPILTRIYGPEDFGALSVFTALVLLLQPFLTLCYLIAIPLPRQDGVAINLMALCLILMFGISLSFSVGLWAFGAPILSLFSMDVLAPYWWLISLGALSAAAHETLNLWGIRRKHYRAIAQSQVQQSAAAELLKIGLGLMATKAFGLVVGQLAGRVTGVASLVVRFRADFQRYSIKVKPSHVMLLAKHYRDFPLYRLPAQLLLIFSIQAPLLFTAAIYDPETTGQLGLALMALALPTSLVGQSMSRAFYAEAAALGLDNAQRIRQITVSVTKRLFLLSLPFAAILFLVGEETFVLVFGSGWRLAGKYASILSIYLVFQFTCSPILHLFSIFRQQNVYLKSHFQRAIIVICAFYFGTIAGVSLITILTIYSIALSIHYIVVSVRLMRVFRP